MASLFRTSGRGEWEQMPAASSTRKATKRKPSSATTARAGAARSTAATRKAAGSKTVRGKAANGKAASSKTANSKTANGKAATSKAANGKTANGKATAVKASRGRAARGKISRGQILLAAIALADQDGIPALSMRKLGDAVGIEAMSLYNHVADKEDLLDGMVDLIFGEIDLEPVAGMDWKEEMRHRALSARAVFSAHPWAIGLIYKHSFPGPATLRHFDDVLGCLRRAGFSVRMTARGHNIIFSYVYGWILNVDQDPSLDRAKGIIDEISADDYPYALELTAAKLDVGGFTEEEEFEAGLDLVLDGLEGVLRRELA